MKSIIIYKGKYGATRQYAEWLSNTLNLPAVQPAEYARERIADSEFLIIGSSVYIGKLQIGDWLKKHLQELKWKKIFLFVVCGTPLNEREKLESYLQGSVPADILGQCEVYFLPGKLVYKNLSFSDKLMLRMGASLTKDKDTKKRMLTDYNNVKEENLEALVKRIGEFASAVKGSHVLLP